MVFSIVDDHPDLCYGVLGRLPRENSSFAAGVMAATVGELLARDAAETRRSDVVLLDLQLKDGSAPAQNIARLKAAEYPVVIYTDEGRPERLLGTLGNYEVQEVIDGFEADWHRHHFDPGQGAHMIWAVGNARERIARLIDGAKP